MGTKLFTSESVTEGHPDKMADQISDAILDATLAQDPEARVAVETLLTNGLVQVAGEMRTEAYVNIQDVVRSKILEIGYDDSSKSFDGNTCGINVAISPQSPDIAQGVDKALEYDGDELNKMGAGDQGIMFGYATDENREMMPTPIMLAHRLTRRLSEVRKNEFPDLLYPDGKSQVTVLYEDGKPIAVDTALVSTQHADGVHHDVLEDIVIHEVIHPVLNQYAQQMADLGTPLVDSRASRYLVNPTGNFVVGGPKGDAGLTGRKIIVDTYGGWSRHGGGAFSGKDASKVDRSAAYALRWVAKHVIAAGLAKRVEVQAAYAIGVAHPIAVYVDSFGTGDDARIERAIQEVFDLRPAAIIRDLSLKYITNYAETARYGHFGRIDEFTGFTWETIDPARVTALRSVR